MQSIDLALGFGLLGGMLILLLIGLPIAYSLLTAGLVGLILTRPWMAVEFLVSTFPIPPRPTWPMSCCRYSCSWGT
ncbi:hypothetical protein ACFSZS_09155 [Seohaeicola zhoushanensis]